MLNKTVLITGGARGMGAVTARALAAMGAHVIIADWDGDQGARRCAEIRADGRGSAEFRYLNLAEPASVRALAGELLDSPTRLDVLINNAGITYPQRRENTAGVEMTFAVCHLGHYLLSQLLLERLRESAPARIIFISSEAHRACQGLDPEDFNNESLWAGHAISHAAAFRAYARAKLANIHTMLHLHEQLQGSGVTVNAVSPGFFINTTIHHEMRGVFRWLAALVFGIGKPFGLNTPERGARTQIWLASSAEVDGISGLYFQACREKDPAPEAQDLRQRQQLIAHSEALTAER